MINDEKALKIIKEELDRDGFDHYELKSIISMSKPNVTSVIVNVGYQEIALEIDNNSDIIISKERIARQYVVSQINRSSSLIVFNTI